MKIVIIGTGNVATVTGQLLKNAGHLILQVYGRKMEQAASLATAWNCEACDELKDIIENADFYLAAISDQALPDISAFLRLPGRIIVHTAGSVPMHILAPISENYGVLYPLQSIRKEFIPVSGIPWLINGSNEQVNQVLLQLASQIATTIRLTTDEERAKLHVAAVIVNNFTNHLYALAEGFCKNEGLDFTLLLPLMLETADRMRRITPLEAVTGPAIRNDQSTIQKHLEILQDYPLLMDWYQEFSRSIHQFNRQKAKH